MGNGYAVELEAHFFRNFAEFAVQLRQSLGLLMYETDRIDDDPSRIDPPNYSSTSGAVHSMSRFVWFWYPIA